MGIIHLLDENVRELISAGEVVERPASVVKELVENSLDAGATKIEVELRRNGLGSIIVTDNGKGMDKEDIPYAFMRHATSKIETAKDLDSIGTLGFRGEALAAICAVSRVRVVTRSIDSDTGYMYRIEGGVPQSLDECGAPVGTSITVSDIFYNTPARMKFLKKDVFEGNAVEDVIWHVALTNPDVAFRFIRDGKQTIRTSGQGLFPAIFDLYPREIAGRMVPVSLNDDNVFVEGYTCDPSDTKASRSLQHVCVNGRYIKSRTIQSAVEEAYRGLMMQGKYPAFVLSIWLPFEEVDVNVHPAKTEIRFRSERAVSSACYKAVKTAITRKAEEAPLDESVHSVDSMFPEMPETKVKNTWQAPSAGADDIFGSVTAASVPGTGNEFIYAPSSEGHKSSGGARSSGASFFEKKEPFDQEKFMEDMKILHGDTKEEEVLAPVQQTMFEIDNEQQSFFGTRETLSVVGQLFDTYIVSQSGDSVYFIDMHAAHERILYEKLREKDSVDSQLLLDPVIVSLSADEKTALLENTEILDKLGFMIEEMGEREVTVRGVPTYLKYEGIETSVTELAVSMAQGRENTSFEAREWLYHSMACRAAIKAGHKCPREEMVELTEKILCGDVPKYCPHGRPVYFKMTKNEIEKKFGRIV